MKNIIIRTLATVIVALSLTSCLNNDETTRTFTAHQYSAGLCILNEGNVKSQINGSLQYLSYSGYTVSDDLYYATNGSYLGGTPNSMLVDHNYGKAYIACTDDNAVFIVDGNIKKETIINITKPREMAADDEYVYVTSYNGTVTKISKKEQAIVATSEKIGDYLEGIGYRNGSLYVSDCYRYDPEVEENWGYVYNTRVVKVDAATLTPTAEITVQQNPTDIKVSDGSVYVLSLGDYTPSMPSVVQKVDVNDNVTVIGKATMFDVYNKNVYAVFVDSQWSQDADGNWVSTSSTSYTRYNADGTTQSFAPNGDIFSPCGIAVDPFSGLIAVSSYQADDKGAADYDGKGMVYLWQEGTNAGVAKEVGVGPCTLIHHTSVYYTEN